jgi:hypothetical protein
MIRADIKEKNILSKPEKYLRFITHVGGILSMLSLYKPGLALNGPRS